MLSLSSILSLTHHLDSPVSQTIGNKSPNSVSFHPKISRWNPIVTCFDPQTDRNADSDLWCAQSLCMTGRDCPSGGSMTVCNTNTDSIMQQVLQQHALEVTETYIKDQDLWLAAAQTLRAPYWDWWTYYHLPRLFHWRTSALLDLTVK